MVALQPEKSDWRRFYRQLRSQTGLDLDLYKPDQIRRRILRLAASKQAASLEDFWDGLAVTPGGLTWLTDTLAINVSRMFRDPEAWEQLNDRILPGLTAGRSSLRCWSAGCSFGAEAHTLGIVLDLHHPGRHNILGTDIDSVALMQARKGLIREHEMGDVARVVRETYFTFDPASSCWRSKARLARMLRFKEHDLLSETFETDFDLIVCRNLVIYFTDRAKDQLYRRLRESLRVGGVLFLGTTERILCPELYGFEQPLPHFYRRVV